MGGKPGCKIILKKQGDKKLPPIFAIPMVLGNGGVSKGMYVDNQDTPSSKEVVPNTVFQVDELIHHTGNKEDCKCDDVKEWADHYCKEIWETAKKEGAPNGGAFHLVATSMGGILAHQIALAAERLGAPIDIMIMADPIPILPWKVVQPDLLGMANAANWITGFFLGGKQDVSGVPEDDIPEYIAKKNSDPDIWGVKAGSAIRCVWQYFNFLDIINKGGAEMQKPCKAKVIFLNATDRGFMPMLFKCSDEEAKNEKNEKGMGNAIDIQYCEGSHPAVGGSFIHAGKSTAKYRTEVLPPLLAKHQVK